MLNEKDVYHLYFIKGRKYSMKIKKASCGFEKEPLKSPFGFKGRYVNDIWQTSVFIEDESQRTGLGLGCQSVLWSDAAVFEKLGQDTGNQAMFSMTGYAVSLAKDKVFSSPPEMLDYLLPETLAYGKKITGNADLRTWPGAPANAP